MPVDAAVQKRLADWRDKLIDLTRSNRLLNYRPHHASSVRVVEEDPNEIAQLLLDGKTLVVDPEPVRAPLGEEHLDLQRLRRRPQHGRAVDRAAPPGEPAVGVDHRDRDAVQVLDLGAAIHGDGPAL